ncbi:hypothetical protein [Brevibacillus laterosporus]|uniref:hypothetical protein n=1 Tax=Brevibacillus laterosporus TaxID=1465 RepID=UPI000B9B9466|nr:hypothetical protein [Brevibacillus laterosporus]
MGTMPLWFWVLYYLFILITIILTIVCMIKKKHTLFSAVTLIFTILAPVVFFLNSLTRGYGNEFEFFYRKLCSGEIWAIFGIVALAEIGYWYFLLIKAYKDKQ